MTEDEARDTDTLSDLIDEVEDGGSFTITRNGQPIAIVIGVEEYRLLGGEVSR